jgi:hypothetical protein
MTLVITFCKEFISNVTYFATAFNVLNVLGMKYI